MEKVDLMEIFEDAFRQAKFNEMERSSILKSNFNHNTMMKHQVHFGQGGDDMDYQSALAPGPSGQTRILNK